MSEALAAVAAKIKARLLERGGTERGDEIAYRCLEHDDEKASASFNVGKGCFKCHACSAKGGCKKLALALGIETPSNKPDRPKKAARAPLLVAEYPYHDEAGALLFEKLRFEPKDFMQRRPDGNGGQIYNLDGVRRVLYRLPELIAAPADATVFVVEGEKDVNCLRSHRLTATCNTEVRVTVHRDHPFRHRDHAFRERDHGAFRERDH